MADSSKTEQATPRRRQKAREQGQVVRSRDLISSLATIAGVLTIAVRAPALVGIWGRLLRHTLDAATSNAAFPLLAGSGLALWSATGMVLALTWAMGMVGALGQGSLVFATAALTPKLERLNPVARLGQLFSFAAVGRVLKSLLPGGAVVYLSAALLARDWGNLVALSHRNIRGLAALAMGDTFEIAWKSSLVLLFWSGADYLLERQRVESSLRMSRQDLMDEHKEIEGNPATKGRIRRLQRQMRRRQMLKEVEKAEVVITNPNEFAVALEYRPDMAAPTVVAKGRNLFARQIKEIARWKGIPLVENPPLAHALYRAVEVGQSIPSKLYSVVAGILAAIYRAEAQSRSATGNPSAGGGK